MQQLVRCIDATVPPERSGFSAERLGRIAEFFDRQTQLGVIPSRSALVARHGEPVYTEGGGLRDLELGLPVEPTILWRLRPMMMTHHVECVAILEPVAKAS